MLGFLKSLFPVPDLEKEKAWQAQLAINQATVFKPEGHLTDEQYKLAEACIEEFKALFGNAEAYNYDLRTFEGPFLIPPDKLDGNTRSIYNTHLERARKETDNGNFNVWLFEFRKGEDVVHFFADTINGDEWVSSTLGI